MQARCSYVVKRVGVEKRGCERLIYVRQNGKYILAGTIIKLGNHDFLLDGKIYSQLDGAIANLLQTKQITVNKI